MVNDPAFKQLESPTRVVTKFDQNLAINWYRTPVEPGRLQELNQRSDTKGLAQAGGHLGMMLLTGSLAVYVQHYFSWLLLIPILFAHGTICAFMTNAEHELVHGTVFKSSKLNAFFLNVFGFLRWFPYEYYWASHTEHHKYTLHPPQDMDPVLPTRFTLAEFLKTGFVDPAQLVELLRTNFRLARGRLEGEWEVYLLAQDPVRHSVFRWARILLVGHAAIAAVSIYYGNWIIPLIVSLTPCYGGWLLFLCNNSQHAGLQDKVNDFRLCCRTLRLNPFIEFLYWHMNFHTEHHMYSAVPCYNLPRLHETIKHDLPPTCVGLIETWQQMIEIQRRQLVEPAYQYDPPLPSVRTPEPLASEMNTGARLMEAVTVAANPGSARSDRLWECSVCGFVYSQRLGLPDEGIPPGTAWDDIPADWKCPDCGTGKADFQMVESSGP